MVELGWEKGGLSVACKHVEWKLDEKINRTRVNDVRIKKWSFRQEDQSKRPGSTVLFSTVEKKTGFLKVAASLANGPGACFRKRCTYNYKSEQWD